MKKIILILAMMSCSLYAKVSGEWIGQGEWTYEGQGTPCDMKLSFKQSPQRFTRNSGYFDCLMVGLDVLAAEFTINNQNLINTDGEIVGTISDNTIDLREEYSDTVTVYSKIKIKNLSMDYNESWMHKDGHEIYKIKGRLFTSGK